MKQFTHDLMLMLICDTLLKLKVVFISSVKIAPKEEEGAEASRTKRVWYIINIAEPKNPSLPYFMQSKTMQAHHPIHCALYKSSPPAIRQPFRLWSICHLQTVASRRAMAHNSHRHAGLLISRSCHFFHAFAFARLAQIIIIIIFCSASAKF